MLLLVRASLACTTGAGGLSISPWLTFRLVVERSPAADLIEETFQSTFPTQRTPHTRTGSTWLSQRNTTDPQGSGVNTSATDRRILALRLACEHAFQVPHFLFLDFTRSLSTDLRSCACSLGCLPLITSPKAKSPSRFVDQSRLVDALGYDSVLRKTIPNDLVPGVIRFLTFEAMEMTHLL